MNVAAQSTPKSRVQKALEDPPIGCDLDVSVDDLLEDIDSLDVSQAEMQWDKFVRAGARHPMDPKMGGWLSDRSPIFTIRAETEREILDTYRDEMDQLSIPDGRVICFWNRSTAFSISARNFVRYIVHFFYPSDNIIAVFENSDVVTLYYEGRVLTSRR